LNIYLITRIRMKGARRQNEGEGGEGAHEARVGRLLARRGRRGRRREGSLSLIIRNSIDCPTVVPRPLPVSLRGQCPGYRGGTHVPRPESYLTAACICLLDSAVFAYARARSPSHTAG
jgi:hypothetical protein